MAAPEPSRPGSVGERLDQAIRRGFDIENEAAGAATTTPYSPWVGNVCRVCRHTFRIGDRVWGEGDEDSTHVVHDEFFLPCRHGAEAPAAAWPRPSVLAVRLNQAAERQNPGPFPSLRLLRLEPGHPLLRSDLILRKRCLGCDHTFRPFETVALCPCRPLERLCRLAAHRDVTAGLLCYDPVAANPDMKHCPMSFNKLPKKRAVAE
jgi:hypothetical protein